MPTPIAARFRPDVVGRVQAALGRKALVPSADVVLEAVALSILSLAHPFPDYASYAYAMRARWMLGMRLRALQALQQAEVQEAQGIRDETYTELSAELATLLETASFRNRGQRAAGTAAAGAAAGAVFGPLAPIASAVGAVAGFIAGMLPIEEWKLFDNWRAALDRLDVKQRMAVYRVFKTLSDAACQQQGITPFPPMRLMVQTGPARGGQSNVVYILWQAVHERDSWVPGERKRVLDAAISACNENPDTDVFDRTWGYWVIVHGNKGSQWLKPHFMAMASRTCREIRTEAAQYGLAEIGGSYG